MAAVCSGAAREQRGARAVREAVDLGQNLRDGQARLVDVRQQQRPTQAAVVAGVGRHHAQDVLESFHGCFSARPVVFDQSPVPLFGRLFEYGRVIPVPDILDDRIDVLVGDAQHVERERTEPQARLHRVRVGVQRAGGQQA